MPDSFYLFALPDDLLNRLVLRTLQFLSKDKPQESEAPHEVHPAPDGAARCNICPSTTFQSVEEQRGHFRSDWHRYNVKLRLSQVTPVSESEFAALVDALDESISGSASSDESSASELDAVQNLLLHQRIAKVDEEEESPRHLPRTALSWFHSPPSTQIGVYNAIFHSESPDQYVSELKQMQLAGQEGRLWTMLMIAGGHFAGMVVRLHGVNEQQQAAEGVPRKKPGKSRAKTPSEYEIVYHKTFHRYTTRRKQGGAQSANDKSKGHAISAGAMLRRYGEQALQEEIHDLLLKWSDEIHASERIWFRAGTTSRRTLLGYDGAVIEKNDARLRSLPFPTKRPTHSELLRCLRELTHPRTSHLTEEALREQDASFLASLEKTKVISHPAPKATIPSDNAKPQMTPEQILLGDKWDRILEMIKKGRLDALRQYWEREGQSIGGVDTPIPDWCTARQPTLLHFAAQVGEHEIVRWLLEGKRANPTLSTPEPVETAIGPSNPRLAQVPFDIASTREVRNVFRRCAAEHPDWWDWFGKGHVPSTLTKEMESERGEKKKARRKELRDKVKERMTKDAPVEEPDEIPSAALEERESTTLDTNSGVGRLGGRSGDMESLEGLSAEMRTKIERERRARAAEARLLRS